MENGMTYMQWLGQDGVRNLIFLFGGIFGFGFAFWRIYILDKQRKTLDEQRKTDEQRLYIDSYLRAVEQLGATKKEVRLGAIHELKKIFQGSAAHRVQIIEILCAYVVANAHGHQKEKERPPIDILAALNIINSSREKWKIWKRGNFRPNLQHVDFRNTSLSQHHFEKFDLREAKFQGADLYQAHLEGTHLARAHLESADLTFARLKGANLRFAHLKNSKLSQAHFESADLFAAHLEGSDLHSTHLQGANLHDAHFEDAEFTNADLKDAKLPGTHLEGADLRHAQNLTQQQINQAFGDRTTKLPRGIQRPELWQIGDQWIAEKKERQ